MTHKMFMRNALIIGGTKGIGREICLALAEKCDNIIITYKSDKANGMETIGLLKNYYASAHLYKLDISNTKAIQSFGNQLLKKFKQIHVLINNVGINSSEQLNHIRPESWNKIIDTNLRGTFWLCKIFGKHMYEHNNGSVVNIASTAGLKPLPKSYHYIATKAAIIKITEALAKDLAPHVRINTVAPGYLKTHKNENNRKTILDQIPLRRFCEPTEIASVVSFIALDATYVTGQTIVVDGGLTL
jgi:3-oxoacyl-[acyl-carrier protein] reductase